MVVIYGKDNCTFCEQAKKLCEMKGVSFQYKKVGVDLTREQLMDICPVPVRSVPQIFINDEYVGGYPELVKKVNM
jgi:glutaredoxin